MEVGGVERPGAHQAVLSNEASVVSLCCHIWQGRTSLLLPDLILPSYPFPFLWIGFNPSETSNSLCRGHFCTNRIQIFSNHYMADGQITGLWPLSPPSTMSLIICTVLLYYISPHHSSSYFQNLLHQLFLPNHTNLPVSTMPWNLSHTHTLAFIPSSFTLIISSAAFSDAHYYSKPLFSVPIGGRG